MPTIIETVVYRLDELSDSARENARAWYRQGAFDYNWFDSVYDDFKSICSILGIHLKTSTVRLYGGGTREDPCIYFRGFWNQGDGACFEANYAHAKGAPRRIREYAPKDTELHRIADALQAIQRRNFYQLRADARHRGNYFHEYCMTITVEREGPTSQDMTVDAEKEITQAFRDLARWLYRQLEQEYEYLSSDEAVEEAILANAYTFTETGERFGYTGGKT